MTSTERAVIQKVIKILHASGINSKAIARAMLKKLLDSEGEREC